jgi:hypothetical protein
MRRYSCSRVQCGRSDGSVLGRMAKAKDLTGQIFGRLTADNESQAQQQSAVAATPVNRPRSCNSESFEAVDNVGNPNRPFAPPHVDFR